MKKLMILILSLLLCAYNASENKERETSKEDPKNKNTTVPLVGVGDNLIYEMIYRQADAVAGKMNDGKYDFTGVHTHVKKDIQKADLVYTDQELIVGGDALNISGYPTPDTSANIVKNVTSAGFDVVSTANSHCLDKCREGIDYPRGIWVKQKGIITARTYTFRKDRDTIRTIRRRGITSSFPAYTYGTNGIEPLNPYSVAYFDKDRIREDAKEAKQLSDVVIVSVHRDDGNVSAPMEFQREYTKLPADLGVDAAVGKHPYVIQPVTWTDGKDGNKTLVIYSLGNLLNRVLDADSVLGGMIRFDFVKDVKSNEISIQNVRWEPLIIHYTGDTVDIMNTRKNFTVYELSDYNEELAEQHGLNGVDGQKVRLNDPYARTKKAIIEIPIIEKGDTK